MQSSRNLIITAFYCLVVLSISAAAIDSVKSFANTEAYNTSLPGKESFLAAWEQSQKNQPTTLVFEKTSEHGVYNFETTLFPYKGRIKVLNVLVDKEIGYYFNEDIKLETSAMGAAEVKLVDASGDFEALYPYSSEKWRQQNVLFYITSLEKWMSKEEWEQHKAEGMSRDSVDEYSTRGDFMLAIYSLLPHLIFIASIVFIVVFVNRKQRQQTEMFNTSLERQLESIKIQKEVFELIKEQTELLRDMNKHKK